MWSESVGGGRPAADIYFDGSFLPGSGRMFALITVGAENFLFDTGEGRSSTHAEWVAAIVALELGHHLGLRQPKVTGDSDNVILSMMPPDEMPPNKLSRRTGPGLSKYRRQVVDLAAELGGVTWGLTSSIKNPAGEVFRQLLALGERSPLHREWAETGLSLK